MITLDLFQILLLIGFGNALLLVISVSGIRPRYRNPTRYLALFIAGYLAYHINLLVVPDIQQHLSFVLPKLPVLFFLPPLFYYFTRATFEKGFSPVGRSLLLLIPGGVDILYQISAALYLQQASSGSLYAFITGRTGFFLYEGAGILFSILCLGMVLDLVLRKQNRNTDAFQFFKYLLGGTAIIIFRWILFFFIDLSAPGIYPLSLQYFFWIADAVFLLYVGYKILTAPRLLRSEHYGHLSGGQQAWEREAARLKRILTEQKLYLDQDLSRKDLAEQMDLSEVDISSIINEGLNTTWYHLLNRLRVEEAVRLIGEGVLDTLTVQGLAGQAGFRSKTTFNRAFKQITGTTPSRYRG